MTVRAKLCELLFREVAQQSRRSDSGRFPELSSGGRWTVKLGLQRTLWRKQVGRRCANQPVAISRKLTIGCGGILRCKRLDPARGQLGSFARLFDIFAIGDGDAHPAFFE